MLRTFNSHIIGDNYEFNLFNYDYTLGIFLISKIKPVIYYTSRKLCPFLYSESLYENGQDSLDIQYFPLNNVRRKILII